MEVWGVALSCWNGPSTSECTMDIMDADDQPGPPVDVSGVPYHSNWTRPTPLQSPHQLKQSPADMQGQWIHELVSMPVHVHSLDTFGNENRQTRQHVSSHQEVNLGVYWPWRGVNLRVVQSVTIHGWACGSESPY